MRRGDALSQIEGIREVPTFLYTHTHTQDYYSAIKKNEIMPFTAKWMNLEIIILSEISQKEEDKHHRDHLNVESKV